MIDKYIKYSDMVENRLKELFDFENEDEVIKAMKYSIFADGKRIRPVLTLEFCNLCCYDPAAAIDYACAVEMIHTYSLIHDDLPCMDDDDMRRGKPSCHIKFGEATALLAGDALLTYAFEVVSKSQLPEINNALAVMKLSHCAGFQGMIGGQTLDLQNECKAVDLDTVKMTDYLKTSKLIEAACCLGCIAADSDSEKIENACKYAENMGLAFQIVDDILDVTSTTAELGKPVGSDDDNKKSTYVSLLGLEKSEKLACEFSEKALKSLEYFGKDAADLIDFTESLLSRKK